MASERADAPRSLRRVRRRVRRYRRRRIVVGASGVSDRGWIPTEQDFLDLLVPADWQRWFDEGSLDAILAEHVWEHLAPAEGEAAAALCFRYLRPGGYVRAAVPDGLHPSAEYREWVRPGGGGPGAEDHKVLYTYGTFGALFERVGFSVQLLEYFDEHGVFHEQPWDPGRGMIHRSRRFDDRNRGGALAYTSLVLDARK